MKPQDKIAIDNLRMEGVSPGDIAAPLAQYRALTYPQASGVNSRLGIIEIAGDIPGAASRADDVRFLNLNRSGLCGRGL